MYFVARGLRDPAYFRRLGERFGFLGRPFGGTPAGGVWLHAVSVGEVLSSVELLRRLRTALPTTPLFVSSSTLAGRAMAEEKLAGIADAIFFAPADYRLAVRRVLRALRPAAVVALETEIWPNLYREARRSGAALLVINGRISDRTIRRYLRLKWFFGPVLAQADAILAQSERDGERYLSLGAPPERVMVAGNLKYDFEPRQTRPPEAVLRFLKNAGPSAVWIAASTMPPREAGDVDEDDAVIAAYVRLRLPNLLLILVPRKPERFEQAAAKLAAAGLRFVRRSGLDGGEQQADVLLLDSMGELSSLFALADVVFMGGTLARRGGHNILEPAFFGRAVVAGPHMENFAEMAEDFTRRDALVRIGGEQELAAAIGALLADPERRAALGERARAAAEARRGATARVLDHIVAAHRRALPASPPHALLAPLAWAWRAGGAIRARWQLAHRGRLSAPVISVGNIAMGGTGKTPFVLWLARKLRDAGSRPAILTRGYRRRSGERVTLCDAGASTPVETTGDEAQLILRSGLASLGIGADRLRAGTELEQCFHPDVILLDDGFQHRPIHRDVDIVLIDALDPFAGGRLFPVGRLREPLAALGRADAFVLTRCGPDPPAIAARLRQWNARAPVFHARVVPECWVNAATGETQPPGCLPFQRAVAFCGLANPAAFWRTLDEMGMRCHERRSFGDHHRYTAHEVEELAAGADALLTTEKDFMNLPAGLAQPPVFWLRIKLEVAGEDELMRFIASRLSSRRL